MRAKLLALVISLAVATPAWAGDSGKDGADLNVVRSVKVEPGDGGTKIVIEGSSRPTYSVFKLSNPLRLFVDLSNSQLDKELRRAPITVDNGVITSVAMMDFSDDLQQISRVIVGFENHATYDVRGEGNSVIIFIAGTGRGNGASAAVNAGDLERHQIELERARAALDAKERSLAETERKVASLESALSDARAGDNRAALAKSLDTHKREANALRSELGAREARVQELDRELRDLEGRVAQSEARHDAAVGRADSLEKDLAAEKVRASKLQQQLDKLASQRDAATQKAKALTRERDQARTNATSLTAERDAERARAASAAKDRDAAKARAKRLADERDAARKDSDRFSAQIAKAQARLNDIETELATARDDLKRVEADRRSAIESATALREQVASLRDTVKARDRDTDKARRDLAAAEKRIAQARIDQASKGEDKGALEALVEERNAMAAKVNTLQSQLARTNNELAAKEKELGGAVAKARSIDEKELEARSAADAAEAERRQTALLARKAEDDRLSALEKARRAEEQRLAALEAARTKEEQRLVALETARNKEEQRLSALETSRKAEEKRLRNLETARKNEEKRLDAAEKALAAEEKALAKATAERQSEEKRVAALRKEGAPTGGSDSRLVKVTEKGDQATLHIKGDTRAAVVETHNTIKAVRFQQQDDISRIIIQLNEPGDFETVPWKAGKASLLIKGVKLPKSLQRTLDTQAFGGTVRYVSSYQPAGDDVTVEAHVPSATTEIVRKEGNTLVWEFSSIGAGNGVGTNPAGPADVQPTSPVPSGFTAAPPRYVRSARSLPNLDEKSPPWQRRPSGMARKRVDIELRGADIQNVLRLLAREGGVNIVSGDDVKGSVTLKLKNVLLSDAFVVVLKSLKLGYEQDGEILRVSPAAQFEAEAASRRQAIIDSFPLEPLEVVLMPVNYASAEQLKALVKTVLSSRGSVEVDQRTNTLIIKDVTQNLSAAQQLVLSVDTQTPQILIEGRIVETNDRYRRQIGIQWGGEFIFAAANGNPTGLAFPSSVGVAGAANDGGAPTSGLAGSPNFAVNLPAPIGTGSGGGIGIQLGSIGGGANLALRLSALEEEGAVKIVSAPRILTLDNEQATISQGVSIPISQVSAAGVQTQFVEARLELSVQPHVTQDGNILINVTINKSEPDFENTGARGDPTIVRREAQTRLLLGDGDTTVIGGIYTQTSGQGASKVPFLGDIPILGWFFRDFSENELRSELLIFLTPRVVNREAALDSRRLNPISAPDVSGGGGK